MTLRKNLLALAFICSSVAARSQDVDSMLTKLSRVYPDEVMYTQTDRTHFFAGDTVWFKSYVMQGGVPSGISTTLLADLADANGKLIKRTTWPMIEGTGAGHFELNDLKPGVYQFRSYTPWMMNQDTAFFFRKNIYIIDTEGASGEAVAFDYSVQLLPEGGNWVAGVVNNMAFIARGVNGKPVAVKGKIIEDEDGETVTELASVHDGMGNFLMVPQAGKKYTAIFEAEGKERTVPLPEALTNAVALRAQQANGQLLFQLQAGADFNQLMPTVTVAGYMNQQMVYKAIAQVEKMKDGISGRIPLQGLPTGVLVLTVFSDKFKPVAERISFVKEDSSGLPEITLLTDTLNLQPRGKNIWQLELPESTSRTNMSVSITDADRVPAPEWEENMLSRFQLTAELKGKIYNPGWYLLQPYDSTKKALDLLMLTHGWRKYNWELMARNIYPPVRVKPESYLTMKGEVTNASGRKSLPNQEITMIVTGSDSSRQFLSATTDMMGSFKIPEMIFYDTVQVFYQLNNVKGDSKDVKLRLSPSVTSLMQALPPLGDRFSYITEDTALANLMANRKAMYEKMYGAQGMLDEVVVRARKKTPLQELDEKYASGMFTGDNGTSFDFINDPPMGMMDIFQFLQGRVAGLQVSGMGANVNLSYRGGTPGLFLDQMPVDAQTLSSIPVTDIAMVKVFRPPFFGGAGGGANGAIAIYTKRGDDFSSSVPGLEKAVLGGYSKVKIFYNPDYEEDPYSNPYGDYRATLYWNPYLFTTQEEKKAPIRFFNNDMAKKYRIVVEGFDANGRLLRLEKVVEPGK